MGGMIQVDINAPKTLVSNTDTVKFDNITLRTNSAQCFNGWLGYNEGAAQFNILAGGIYEIDFNTNITSSTAGVVGLALFADGVQLEGTEMNSTLSAANAWENVSMNRKIRVCTRGNVTLTIASVPTVLVNGVSTATQIPTVKGSNISITRLA